MQGDKQVIMRAPQVRQHATPVTTQLIFHPGFLTTQSSTETDADLLLQPSIRPFDSSEYVLRNNHLAAGGTSPPGRKRTDVQLWCQQ